MLSDKKHGIFLDAVFNRLRWKNIAIAKKTGLNTHVVGRHRRGLSAAEDESFELYAEVLGWGAEDLWVLAQRAVAASEKGQADEFERTITLATERARAKQQGRREEMELAGEAVRKLAQLCGARTSPTNPVDALVRALTLSRDMPPDQFESVTLGLWRWWDEEAAPALTVTDRSPASSRLPHAAKVPSDPRAGRPPEDRKDEGKGKTG